MNYDNENEFEEYTHPLLTFKEKLYTVLTILGVLAAVWFGLIGISRLEPATSPCHQRGDTMLRWMGVKS